MKKIKPLLIAGFLILTLFGACFSASAVTKVGNIVQQPQQPQQPQQGGEGTIVGTTYNNQGVAANKTMVMLWPAGSFVPTNIIPLRDNVDGSFVFNNVPSGWYRLVAIKPLNASGWTSLFYVTDGGTRLRNIYLTHGFKAGGANYSEETGNIAGTIYDENTPIDGAYAILFEKGEFKPYDSVQSESDGSYGFNDVPTGQYRIIATNGPLHNGSGVTSLFVVSEGETTIIDIFLNNLFGETQEYTQQQSQQQQPQQQQVVVKQQVLLSK